MRLIDADALMDDINRAINAMTAIGIVVDGDWLWAKLNDALDNAPTIEPEKRTEKRTETNACDSISRQAALKEAIPVPCEGDVYMMVQVETLEGLPSVEPDLSEYSDKLWKAAYERGKAEAQAERKTGRWIPQDHNRRNGYVTTTVYFYPKCSECGYSGNYGMNYCPNCGARMEEQDD